MSIPEPAADGQVFVLQPFGSTPATQGLQVEGRLEREGDEVRVWYQLSGDLESVVVPSPVTGTPTRRDGLWEHTCFELFLAVEGAEPYWEMNLAPNGDWNLYRLAGYRRGLQPVPDRDALPFGVRVGPMALELMVTLRLPQELTELCHEHPMRLGVTAVIERRSGELSYWALAHGQAEADFHQRKDFQLRLEP